MNMENKEKARTAGDLSLPTQRLVNYKIPIFR
jgi:hypothetical protein